MTVQQVVWPPGIGLETDSLPVAAKVTATDVAVDPEVRRDTRRQGAEVNRLTGGVGDEIKVPISQDMLRARYEGDGWERR